MLPEAVDVVIGSVRRDRLDRQVTPLRELPSEQPPHEGGVGLDLVSVHAGARHLHQYPMSPEAAQSGSAGDAPAVKLRGRAP